MKLLIRKLFENRIENIGLWDWMTKSLHYYSKNEIILVPFDHLMQTFSNYYKLTIFRLYNDSKSFPHTSLFIMNTTNVFHH